ncbi:hypothetical protein LG293_16715 (plasmid) [Citricoccus nitrophenolicus]
MNKQRRKAINDIHDRLSSIKDEIETQCDEEQSAYDNLPESIQESDRGHAAYEAAEALKTALESVDEALDRLMDAAS